MSTTANSTEQKKVAFLAAYVQHHGNISKACTAAGVGRTAVYEWLKQPTFVARQKLADAAITDAMVSVVTTVATGYTLPQDRVFMVPVVRTEIVKGKPVRVETREAVIVPMKKHVGPDFKAAQLWLEANAKHLGYGKTEVAHSGTLGLDIKTIVLREVQPTHGLPNPNEPQPDAT